MPPAILMALPLNVVSLTAHFLGPSSICKRLFDEDFFGFLGEKS